MVHGVIEMLANVYVDGLLRTWLHSQAAERRVVPKARLVNGREFIGA
jgi:hypothetical protein